MKNTQGSKTVPNRGSQPLPDEAINNGQLPHEKPSKEEVTRAVTPPETETDNIVENPSRGGASGRENKPND